MTAGKKQGAGSTTGPLCPISPLCRGGGTSQGPAWDPAQRVAFKRSWFARRKKILNWSPRNRVVNPGPTCGGTPRRQGQHLPAHSQCHPCACCLQLGSSRTPSLGGFTGVPGTALLVGDHQGR